MKNITASTYKSYDDAGIDIKEQVRDHRHDAE